MKNEEKYKTAQERQNAFKKFCKRHSCSSCPASRENSKCILNWLELEFKEPPREMEDIIKELRELSFFNPMFNPNTFAIGDCISTIYGKPIRWYLGDLANEIEAAWKRRTNNGNDSRYSSRDESQDRQV